MTSTHPSDCLRRAAAGLLAGALALACGGCFGVPDIEAGAPAAGAVPATPRDRAIAEMHAEAVAGDRMPYPSTVQANRAALAARSEPLSTQQVEAIQTELSLIAAKRAQTSDAKEIAALDARARELRREVLRLQPQAVRQ
jgi:hypothetical protein